MVTQQQIDNYIASIRYAIAEYAGKTAKKQMIGSEDLFCRKNNVILLSAYLDIIVDYFEQDPYDPNNFFTTTEIRDIMQHINAICDTNYILTNL